MIKVKFLRSRIGHEIGEIKEYDDNNSGLIRSWVADGYVEVLREKVHRIEPKSEKVKTSYTPKKPVK